MRIGQIERADVSSCLLLYGMTQAREKRRCARRKGLMRSLGWVVLDLNQ